MSGYKSVGYALELMFTPEGVTVELFPAELGDTTPIATVTAATADEAVRDLFDSVTLDAEDDEEED